jgi:hypothetical protein
LENRGSKLKESTIKENSFLLANSYNDIWFQELSLVQLWQKELAYFYKFFEGPRNIPNLDFMLSS